MAPSRRLPFLPVLDVVGVRNRLREALATMATIKLKNDLITQQAPQPAQG